MKRGPSFILLIFAASFLLPLSCAYSCYNLIVEVDFLTNGVKYEAGDIENLSVDKQNLTGVVPFPCGLFLEENFFELLLGFSIPTPLMHPTSSVLRC
jgi:hypothetical protein